VLKAAGESETMQENIQDWLQLDEGDAGVLLLIDEKTAAVIWFYLFSSAQSILLNFPYISIPILSVFYGYLLLH
jgi:hypothetical protein